MDLFASFEDSGGRSTARSAGDKLSEQQQKQRLGVDERNWAGNDWVAGNKGGGARSARHPQVLGSLDTDSHLLFTSEPPDIRNWFSSYVYQSPALDASEDFGSPDYQKSKVDNREEVESETVSKGGENSFATRKEEDDVVPENLTSSPSCSILVSEPPDIRNWFSSYIYESPALDSSEDLGFPDYRYSKVDRTEIKSGMVWKGGENSIVTEDNAVSENLTSSELKKFDGMVEHNKDQQRFFINHQMDKGVVVDRESLSVLNGSPSKGIHEATLKDQDDLKSREAKDHVNLSAQNSSDMNESTRGSSWKTTRSKNKENTGNGSPGNNFVSTRKGRCKTENDENSLERSGGDQWRSLGHRAATSSVDDKDEMVIRKVLTETTNLQHSGLSEITGKWKCPRKNKPDLGPPLKQLRLERWVHRA